MIWFLIACAALYLPARKYMASRGYESANDFFEDLLTVVIGLSILIIPIVIIYLLLFKNWEGKKTKRED